MELIYAKVWRCCHQFNLKAQGQTFEGNGRRRIKNKSILRTLCQAIKEDYWFKSQVKIACQTEIVSAGLKNEGTCK